MDRLEIAQRFAAKYLGIVNSSEVQYLGDGSFAYVYSARDKVIKVTRDEHDAILSHKLMDKNYTNIVKTFSVNKFFSHKEDKNLFIIVNERLETLDYGHKHQALNDFIDNFRGVSKYFSDEVLVEKNFNEYYDDTMSSHRHKTKHREILTNCLPQFKNLMRELTDLDVRHIDAHSGNFGFSGNIIKLLDVGYESSDGILKGIKEVEL